MGCRAGHRIERISLSNIPTFIFLSFLLIFSLTTLASPSDDTYYGHIEREKWSPSEEHSSSSSASMTYVRYYKLHNRCSGRHVSVRERLVQAKAEQKSQYAWLRIETVSFESRIRIRSNTSHYFLCFTANGSLTVKHSPGVWNRCSFHEVHASNDYTQFRSAANANWFIGFNKKGRRLAGNQWKKVKNSSERMKCFQFMKTEMKPDPHDGSSSSSSSSSRGLGRRDAGRAPNGSWVVGSSGSSGSSGSFVGDGGWYEELTRHEKKRGGGVPRRKPK